MVKPARLTERRFMPEQRLVEMSETGKDKGRTHP
jgi:hypothetical protein